MANVTANEPFVDTENLMHYDPAVDREFEGDRRLHLGHECNTPIYVLDGFAQAVCHDKPASWRGKISWRFPMLSGDDRLAIRPKFFYIADQEAENRWLHTDSLGIAPTKFTGPYWMWENDFHFAVQRQDRSILAGGKIHSGIYAGITLTRGAVHDKETLLAVAEVIEALSSDPGSLLGRESDFCCFCGRDLLEPRSRVVGYGPRCAKTYHLAY